jgi:hypothetical protein
MVLSPPAAPDPDLAWRDLPFGTLRLMHVVGKRYADFPKHVKRINLTGDHLRSIKDLSS